MKKKQNSAFRKAAGFYQVAFSMRADKRGSKMEILILGVFIFTGAVLLMILFGSMLAVKYLDEEMNSHRYGGNFLTTCREDAKRKQRVGKEGR